MGPITGIRIVNLRVREKVAYPDLTLDLAGDRADHVVVGLENGGGKSTLLGAVYHVFVPEADQFLPRRAQRRQKKEGEPKRLEHYVPGGDPTHFVVELEAPSREGALPMAIGPRLLVGACLWKPAGSTSATPVNEFFWSARSVTPELTLRHLGLRGPGGRLLDHREFERRLKQLREEQPSARVNVETGKELWRRHLNDELRVDVEYVRQFLLRMNEDEGAADQVFTYASSRSFLNSLVGVVGDATGIADLNKRLSEMSEDADAMVLDRQRVALLERLVAQTAPLAETVTALRAKVAERDSAFAQIAAVGRRLRLEHELARAASATATQERTRLDGTVVAARNAYADANARFALAGVQVARLRATSAEADIQRVLGQRDAARRDEHVARAAALLADRRGHETRVRELEGALAQKVADAEPKRLALASGLQSLDGRLSLEERHLADERTRARDDAAQADRDHTPAENTRSAAQRRIGSLEGQTQGLDEERVRLEAQLDAAVHAGLLRDREADPTAGAVAARDLATAEQAALDEHEQRRAAFEVTLDALAKRDQAAAARSATTAAQEAHAEGELEAGLHKTAALASALEASGFVETSPVSLDGATPVILQRLASAIDTARMKQAAAAVSAAGAERAAVWLRDHERLPPRPDVERLCVRARKERLGARTGWEYLASLPPEAAHEYALSHPGLADGVVVNVPEDFEAMVALTTTASNELDGPVTIGAASVFASSEPEHPRSVVVLPHAAYWSTTAGRKILDARVADAARWQRERDDAAARAEAAISLRQRLMVWCEDIGPSGIEDRKLRVERLGAEIAKIAATRAELAEEVALQRQHQDAARSARDAARERRDDAKARAVQLAALTDVRARLDVVVPKLGEFGAQLRLEIKRRDEADLVMADATQRKSEAVARLERLALSVGELSLTRKGIQSLVAVVVRPGDPVDPEDEAADRDLLALQVRDREAIWRGSISDPELRAKVDELRARIEAVDTDLQPLIAVRDAAAAALARDPARSARDFVASAEEERARIEMLGVQLGQITETHRQLKSAHDDAEKEFAALRRFVTLAVEDTTEDPSLAVAVSEAARVRRDVLNLERAEREAQQQSAAREEQEAAGRVDLIVTSRAHLTGHAKRVGSGGGLVPTLEGGDSPIEPTSALMEPEPLGPLSEVVAFVIRGRGGGASSVDEDRPQALAALADVEAQVDDLMRTLREVQDRAISLLDAAEAILRGAAEDVVRGDQIVQMFRTAERRVLADLCVAHHRDLEQRLAAVRHHVASFDQRLEGLADVVHASVADLLREVKRTVRDSLLPDTAAMGRWAGLELLKLNGIDTLKVHERRAAIAATLRTWFDPERPDARPRRFDNLDVVHGLLAAVTPQFTARILVPSDPLDPEHKPVDHLALETSGGEGVTVALILASLLAARRASHRGHRRTTLMLDNPFAKVTKPEFLRLARDVAAALRVQLVSFTGIRDLGALTVFPRLIQLRVSRRENANFIVPYEIDDDVLQRLLRDGTLFVSPAEWDAGRRADGTQVWPMVSAVSVGHRRSGAP